MRDVAEGEEECDPCIREETEKMDENRKRTEKTEERMTKGVKEEMKDKQIYIQKSMRTRIDDRIYIMTIWIALALPFPRNISTDKCIPNNARDIRRHDGSLGPHMSFCRYALYAPRSAIQPNQAARAKHTAKMKRMMAFHRHETGLLEVKTMIRQRS